MWCDGTWARINTQTVDCEGKTCAGICEVMSSSQALAMVLPGEDRTLNSHIKAQVQPLSGVCRVQFHRFFYSSSFRITGDFCGTDLGFVKTVCFLQQSEEHLKIFLLSIQVCVCACTCVSMCVWKWKQPLCTVWVMSPFSLQRAFERMVRFISFSKDEEYTRRGILLNVLKGFLSD